MRGDEEEKETSHRSIDRSNERVAVDLHEPDDGGRGRGEGVLEEEVRETSSFGLGQEELAVADEHIAVGADVAEAERESSGPVHHSTQTCASESISERAGAHGGGLWRETHKYRGSS